MAAHEDRSQIDKIVAMINKGIRCHCTRDANTAIAAYKEALNYLHLLSDCAIDPYEMRSPSTHECRQETKEDHVRYRQATKLDSLMQPLRPTFRGRRSTTPASDQDSISRWELQYLSTVAIYNMSLLFCERGCWDASIALLQMLAQDDLFNQDEKIFINGKWQSESFDCHPSLTMAIECHMAYAHTKVYAYRESLYHVSCSLRFGNRLSKDSLFYASACAYMGSILVTCGAFDEAEELFSDAVFRYSSHGLHSDSSRVVSSNLISVTGAPAA